jgi:pectate lyase
MEIAVHVPCPPYPLPTPDETYTPMTPSHTMKQIFAFSAALLIAADMHAQQLAFPTAEGSGRFAVGGRGGSVYEVTNLANTGPGSIVDAVSAGNRTIVFRISGTIELGSVILQPKANTTIAGQTAPGDGICIKGRLKIAYPDIIVRHIRVRVDAGGANSSGDAVDISGGTNIIVDHVTASYSRDEGISCTDVPNNVTVQWCLISEALTYEAHSYGSLIRGDYGDQKTYHHNLYAHNNARNPRPGNYTVVGTDSVGLLFDFRNNVVYNWASSYAGYNDDSTMRTSYNIVGNAYISGNESSGNFAFREGCRVCNGYFADNSINGVVPADPWSLVTFRGTLTSAHITAYKARSAPIAMPAVITTSPAQAYTEVLASAGACIPRRDTIDRRIVRDVIEKTGHSIDSTVHQPEGGWPVLSSATPPADSDHDGMPDVWESAHGLNFSDPSDRNNVGPQGYTQLEIYLNSLTGEMVTSVADDHAESPATFALYQNYPNPFNPSTMIMYMLPARGPVTLTLFDVLGRTVRTLVNDQEAAGVHTVSFEGSGLAAGVYYYRLQAGLHSGTRALMLLK